MSNTIAHFSLNAPPTKIDLVCFSHLRWDFVFQRPQHLADALRKKSTRLLY